MWVFTYYFIGAYIKKHNIKISNIKGLVILFFSLLLSFILYFIARTNESFTFYCEYFEFTTLISSVMIFLLCFNIKTEKIPKIINKAITSVSDLSLGTYLMSYIVDIVVYINLLEATQISNKVELYYLPTVIFNFIVSLTLSKIINSIYNLLFKVWLKIKK
jgi:surface polysaccharide O-acyltransferase-like enzyme